MVILEIWKVFSAFVWSNHALAGLLIDYVALSTLTAFIRPLAFHAEWYRVVTRFAMNILYIVIHWDGFLIMCIFANGCTLDGAVDGSISELFSTW
jgi:hypothetical protein